MTDRPHGGPAIAIAWECLSNFIRTDAFSARLSLSLGSDGAAPIAPGWTLYFNTCRKILPETVSPGYAIAHVNGDLFALTGQGAWLPGQTHTIDYEALHWAISITDAPLGFYLVPGGGAAPYDLGDPAIAPFVRPEQRHRWRGDPVPTFDAAARFAHNAPLTGLPEQAVGRITPRPQMARFEETTCLVGRATPVTHDAGLANEAALLAALLAPLPEGAGTTAIVLALDGALAPEGYALDIDAHRVLVRGGGAHGVFNGLQSLAQLMAGDGALPLGVVNDAPRYAYRGLMLDVARHFSSVETVLRLLDCMAAYKLNRFHFHLTDDEGWRLQIAALPELTEVGARRGVDAGGDRPCLPPSFGSGAAPDGSTGSGFYTHDDFIAILRHAHARHIEVIPEFNMPGHARAAVQAMRVRHARLLAAGDVDGANAFLLSDPHDTSVYESVQLWHDNVMCIALASSDRFIDTVVGEVAALFRAAGVPLRVLHTGGDEVPAGAWIGSPICQARMRERGWSDVRQLRDDWQARCRAILARHGVAFAGWEETVLGGDRADTHVYVWNNGGLPPERDCAAELVDAGFDVVACSASSLYFDFAYAKHPLEPGYYWAGFVDTRTPFALAPAPGLAGLQGQLWGENIDSRARLEYLAMPRLIGLAERAWDAAPDTASGPPDWNEFANRLGRRELPRLDRLQPAWDYRLPPPGAIVQGGALHANVAFPGLALHYTVDGLDPTTDSPRYQQPVALRVGATVKLASFDTRGRASRIVTLHPESP